MKWMGIAGALSLALLNTAHANEVVIPGSFSVSESGAANYSIDIAVPPGTAGIEPKLSLTYSSQGGNGLLGVGWSLSGLSSITRCPKTIAQDGVRGAVTFDADDRFCLDGQRLIATSGVYGASGTEYRTEMEGFSRITSSGTTGTGPTSFTVETKSGLTMTFGGTADSRLVPAAISSVASWSLNRVDDTLGNYMTVSYGVDIPNGFQFPIGIYYTGTGNAAPYAVVEIGYETKQDPGKFYQSGALFKTNYRMKTVRTYVSGAVVSEYRLAYDLSSMTSRSRLTSVTKCDSVGACQPPTTMVWPSEAPAALTTSNNVLGFDTYYVGWSASFGDFNGDGFTDILWDNADQYGRSSGARNIWLGNGAGGFTVQTNVAGNDGYYIGWSSKLADFNGDGLTDILWDFVDTSGRTLGNRNIWLSNGAGGFTIQANVAGQDGYYVGWLAKLADFNGDGQADILWDNVDTNGQSVGHRNLWASDGAGGFIIQSNVAGQNSNYSGWVATPADFNGDGHADLLWDTVNGQGQSNGHRNIWLSDGAGGFVIHPNVAGLDGLYIGWAKNLGDFNGDGKTDILWDAQTTYGSSSGTRVIWLSKGDGTVEVVPNVAGADGAYLNYRSQLADFNGDGKSDILWENFFNNGQSGGYRFIWLAEDGGSFKVVSNVAGHDTFHLNYKLNLADFNGDGMADILWDDVDSYGRSGGHRDLSVSTGVPHLFSPVKPDLLSSIDDGFGDKVRLTYAPLTDGSVYTKGSGAIYPEVDLQVPSYVVSRAEVRDGVGDFVPTEYRYGGLKARADGRGSLGFAWSEAEQVETDFVTRREYRQDYPYVGRVSLERTSAPGVGLSGVLSEKTYSFGCLNPANGLGCAVAAGNRYFPYASSIVEKGWDLDGSVLPVVTTSNLYDHWGNATQINVSTSDGFSKSTVNTYTNDAVNWILGRLMRTEVTDVSP